MRKTVKKYRNLQKNTATCSRQAAAMQADGRRTAIETSLTRVKVGRKKPYANRIREKNKKISQRAKKISRPAADREPPGRRTVAARQLKRL